MTRRHLLGVLGLLGAAPRLKITKLVTRKHSIGNRDYLFLEIETDQGITGIGEGSVSGRVDIVEQAIQFYTPHLVGKDPGGIEEHWNRNYFQLSRYRNGPVLMTALSAIDIALWDILGKQLGQPIWRLLGAAEAKPMRVYYSHWSQTLTDRTPANMEALARRTREEGWTCIKWVLPKGGTETERLRRLTLEVEAARKGGGPDMEITLEMWETFTVRAALDFARAVASFKPMWIEEPFWREMPQALGELAAKSPIALAGGEGLISRFEFKQLLDARGAQIIQPDVIHCGGISEIRKIANLGETYGTEISPHMYYGPVAHVASLQSMAAIRNFLIQEWDAGATPGFAALTKNSFPQAVNGEVTLNDKPGLGLEMDWALWQQRHPYKAASLRPPGGR
jgi:galactonate dehydratase